MGNCLGVLLVICFTSRWGLPFVLGAQDALTAFETVGHANAVSVIRQAGATPHQTLALARETQGKDVTMNVPGVAQSGEIRMA